MEAYDDIPESNLDLMKEMREDTVESVVELNRVLGVKSVVALSLAAMVGSVLVLPGPAVALTGSSAIFSVAAAAIIVMAAAFDKSEIATAMPVSGGSYVYLAKAFGPLVGSMAGFALWFSLVFKGAFGLAGFKAYFRYMLGEELATDLTVKLTALGLLTLLLAGNLAGLKKIKTLQKLATLVAMLVCWGVAIYGLTKFERTEFEAHVFTRGSEGFIECIGFVFMGYAGLTKICALASEIKNPEVNMPRSILVSLGLFFPFFSTVLVACLGLIPYEEMKKDYAPMYTLALATGGKQLASVVGVICIVAMTGMANISLMAVARFPFAMSRDGLLPPIFSKTWSNDAPYISLVISALTMGFSIVFLPVKNIAKLCSSLQLIIFALVNVSLIIFRVHNEHWYKPTFRSPFFPYLQLSGIICKMTMLIYLGIDGLVAAIVIFALGFILYYYYGRYHALFIGIIRIEKCFGLQPVAPEPIKAHKTRIKGHPMTEREFEQEIWEYEEDNELPHEAHILQVEQLEGENLKLRQETRRMKVRIAQLETQLSQLSMVNQSPHLGDTTEAETTGGRITTRRMNSLSKRNSIMSSSQSALNPDMGMEMGSPAASEERASLLGKGKRRISNLDIMENVPENVRNNLVSPAVTTLVGKGDTPGESNENPEVTK